MAKKTAVRKTKKKPASKKKTKAASRKTAKKKTTKASRAKKTATKGKKKAAAKKKPARSSSRRRESAVTIQSQHVDFLSYKVDQLKKFYEEVLELKTETRDSDGLSYLLVTTSANSTLGFMPPHPDMRGERPVPREPTLYFEVKNVDRAYSQLSAKGVAFMGPPEDMPWGHRVLTTTDPEGRTIMLASKLPKSKRS